MSDNNNNPMSLTDSVIAFYNSVEGYVHNQMMAGKLGHVSDAGIALVTMKLKREHPEIKWTDKIADYPDSFKATLLMTATSAVEEYQKF